MSAVGDWLAVDVEQLVSLLQRRVALLCLQRQREREGVLREGGGGGGNNGRGREEEEKKELERGKKRVREFDREGKRQRGGRG